MLEVEADLGKLLEGLGGDPKQGKTRETAKVTVNAKELTIANDTGNSLTFKRIKSRNQIGVGLFFACLEWPLWSRAA